MKLSTTLLIIVLLLAIALPVYAGQGQPVIARQGEQSGLAKQAGPNGPNYPHPTETPTTELGQVYTTFVPFVATGAGTVPPAPDRQTTSKTLPWR